MKIAIVAAEVAPHAKAGGLADVIGALPGAFQAIGHEPSLIVPGYASILRSVETEPVARNRSIRIGDDVERFSVLRAADHVRFKDLVEAEVDHVVIDSAL